ncbi:MAG: ABC transporter permease [Clostridia bacterium]|nr:ABC transporter permease [Clostridia bacterium]
MSFNLGFLRKNIAIPAFFITWELVSLAGLVHPLFIPPLSQVLTTIWELTVSGEMIEHILISLSRAFGGFLIAVTLALPLGLLLGGWFRNLQTALEPLMEVAAQANPFILFHVIILFLGIGEATKVTIIAWICIWPIVFNTISGIRNIDPVLLKSARSFGLERTALFTKVILPVAAPSIFTGLRLSAGYAFFMLVVAEMMGSSSGLGWLVQTSQESYNVSRLFSAALVIALLGLLIDTLMQFIEKKVIVWQDTSILESPGYKS